MKKLIIPVLVMICLTIGTSPSLAQQQTQQNLAEEAIMRYINAINLRDYETAYAILTPRNQPYDDFVAGYANTERIIPFFGYGGVATGSIYITTVLLGYQTDQTVETYYGYYRLANGGNFSPPIDGYMLSGSEFQLLKTGTAPHWGTIQTLVNDSWNPDIVLPPEPQSVSSLSQASAITIMQYYDFINARDFASAYARWLSPTVRNAQNDYRPAYDQFVSGYDDTVAVTAYVLGTQAIPNDQATLYTQSFVATVLIGQHTDGGFVAYSGCYALGFLSTPDIGIVNGRFQQLADTMPTTTEIYQALAQLNCSTLEMGL